MTNKNDGGPTYPKAGVWYTKKGYGMSLRDYFAGQALAGILAHPMSDCNTYANAESAYRQADAMLRAREREGGV